MRLSQALAGTLTGTVINYILIMLTGVLTARLLGPEGRGAYVLALLVAYLAVNTLTLGVGSASSYYVARGEQDAGTVVGTSFAIALPLGLISTVGVIAVLRAGLWATPHARFIALAAWSVAPSMGSALVRNAVLGLQRYLLFNWLLVVERAVYFVLIVAAFFLHGDVWLCCFLFVVASFATFLISLVSFLRVARVPLRCDRDYARRALHYGLRGHVGWMAELLNYRLDMLFVEGLAGTLALGFYSAAVSLAETLWILPGCVSQVILPRLASTKDNSQTTAVLCRLLTPLSLAAALAMGLLAGPLVRLLYGRAFEPSITPFLLLLPGAAVLSIVKVLAADFSSRGRPGLVSAVSWISLVVTIVFDLILIRPYGASGAAVASTLAYGTSTLVTLVLYARIASIPPARLVAPRWADARVALDAVRQFFRSPAAAGATDGRRAP